MGLTISRKTAKKTSEPLYEQIVINTMTPEAVVVMFQVEVLAKYDIKETVRLNIEC